MKKLSTAQSQMLQGSGATRGKGCVDGPSSRGNCGAGRKSRSMDARCGTTWRDVDGASTIPTAKRAEGISSREMRMEEVKG